jgi:hypothetical protein
LQALRAHAFDDPLAHPGEADLTAHVDFEALSWGRAAAPLHHAGRIPAAPGDRGAGGAAGAGLTGAALESHLAALRRLTDPAEMGSLFKVLALTGPMPPCPPDLPPDVCRAGNHHLMTPCPRGTASSPARAGPRPGVFAGLNCGTGSSDQAEIVAINRARVAEAMGSARRRLVTVHQVHSPDVVTVTGPLDGRPRADAMVTATPGLALAVLTADCQPVLFADAQAPA